MKKNMNSNKKMLESLKYFFMEKCNRNAHCAKCKKKQSYLKLSNGETVFAGHMLTYIKGDVDGVVVLSISCIMLCSVSRLSLS